MKKFLINISLLAILFLFVGLLYSAPPVQVVNVVRVATTPVVMAEIYKSTFTAGKITAVSTATLSIPFHATKFTFVHYGDNEVKITSSINDGILYLPSYSGISVDVKCPTPITFEISLPSGSTVYYMVKGEKR